MQKNYFLLEDKIESIKNKFKKDAWLTIYKKGSKSIDDQELIFCCLVHKTKVDKYKESYSWPIRFGNEGKPSVYDDNEYRTYDEEGLEPFLFYRSFNLPDKRISYVDISEEFILYFNLLEEGIDKENRKFKFIDDEGNIEDVIIVEPKAIKVKFRFLKEYISLREFYFVLCFEFMRLQKDIPRNWNIKNQDKNFESEFYFYNHLIRPISGKIQSWITGKVFIEPNKEKKSYHSYEEPEYEQFIIGYDDDGNEVFEDCSNNSEKTFRLTFFKKEVLNKYYNDPERYNVDSFSVASKYFRLKIDNNVRDYVPVFLTNLRMLPYKEQLHWKQYNIAPDENMKMSATYYKTMILGSWVEKPEMPDLYFKHEYQNFNKNWTKKFSWSFYKPLDTRDQYLFDALHLPTNDNIKAFCEQILSIVKLTIDRLNEKAFKKYIEVEPGDRGITKLEKFLKSFDFHIPDLIKFLKHLQNMRSGLIAHTFSDSNKDCKEAMKYFEFEDKGYREIAEDIFVKSIATLSTLSMLFALEPTDD